MEWLKTVGTKQYKVTVYGSLKNDEFDLLSPKPHTVLIQGSGVCFSYAFQKLLQIDGLYIRTNCSLSFMQ